MSKPATAPSSIFTSKLLLATMYVAFLGLIVLTAVSIEWPVLLDNTKDLRDFDAFYVAGQMALDGRVDASYDAALVKEAQILHIQTYGAEKPMVGFMPWTYPPIFTLILQPLSALPLWLSYVVFTASTLGLLLAVLRKISDHHVGAMLLTFPILFVNLASGQNGYLTAALIGLFLVLYNRNKTLAGLPLGLMIIKPHLAVGISMASLLGRRWGAMALAAVTVIALIGITTAVYSFDVWGHFLQAVRDAKDFLASGRYPLVRMTSVYAMFRSFGMMPQWAFALHMVGCVIALAVLAFAWMRKLPARYFAAVVCLTSLFISPYNYDYDIIVLTVALAFILPDILARTRKSEQCLYFVLCWIVTGIGWMSQVYLEGLTRIFLGIPDVKYTHTVTAALLVFVGVVTTLILRRQPKENLLKSAPN